MWRTFLISLGFLATVLAGCDPEVLVASASRGDSYEVVTQVAN